MTLEDYGDAVLRWPDSKAEDRGLTVWNVAAKDSPWFSPSQSSFTTNYRVDDLREQLEQLRAAVKVIQGAVRHENGKIAWSIDPDGNEAALWEPNAWHENKGA